ncbi:hypothetical protein SDJN02_27482, partial [Cucurbita argyrosperma subsp. argyrosperma]
MPHYLLNVICKRDRGFTSRLEVLDDSAFNANIILFIKCSSHQRLLLSHFSFVASKAYIGKKIVAHLLWQPGKSEVVDSGLVVFLKLPQPFGVHAL